YHLMIRPFYLNLSSLTLFLKKKTSSVRQMFFVENVQILLLQSVFLIILFYLNQINLLYKLLIQFDLLTIYVPRHYLFDRILTKFFLYYVFLILLLYYNQFLYSHFFYSV